MKLRIAAAVAVVGVVGLGAAAMAQADTRSNADAFYFCIGAGNVPTHAYPVDGWHGNSCAAGETRYVVQGVPADPTNPPSTDPPVTNPPTTDPPVTNPPTTDPPVTTPPVTTPPPTTDPPVTDPPPVQTGFPDASTTGVQDGVTLTNGTCPGTITKAGTTIQNVILTNCSIRVQASNVTIKNSKLLSSQLTVWDDQPAGDITGVILDHLDIDGQMHGSTSNNDYAVGGGYGGGFSLTNSDIQGWDTGVMVNADPANAVVRGNYIHNLGPASSVHKTAVSSNGGGGNAVIDGNNLDCNVSGCSAALSFYGDFDNIHDWKVTNNLFNTEGSYCTYAGTVSGKKFPTATNITWTGNAYGRVHNAQCGQYGPATSWSNGGGNTWSGNYWADTKATIPAP